MASKGDAVMKAIRFTAKKLTLPDCKELCGFLEITEVEIDTIMQDNQGDARSQKHKMLSKWKEKYGKQATLEKFLKALEDSELTDVRDKLVDWLKNEGYSLPIAQETASGTDHREASMQSSHVPKESPTSFTHSAQQQIPRTAKTCADHQPTDSTVNTSDSQVAIGQNTSSKRVMFPVSQHLSDAQAVVTSTGICTDTTVTNASSAVNQGPDQNITSQVSNKACTDQSMTQSGRNYQQPSQEALSEESQQATVQSAVQQEVSQGSSSSVHQDIEQQTREMVDQGNHQFVQTTSTTGSSSGIQDLGNHDIAAGLAMLSVGETQGAGHAGQHHTVTQESDTTSQHEIDGKESIPAYPTEETQSKPTDTFQHWKDSKLGHRLKMFTREEIGSIINCPDGSNIIENGVFGMIYKGPFKCKMVKCSKILDVAVKEVRVNSLTDEGENDFKKRSVANLRHPHIVPVIGICAEPSKLLFIVYSYLGSNLEQALKTMVEEKVANENSLDQYKCLQIVTQIASALIYLHRQSPQIIHLDVKPSNILLDSSFNARLADVGFIKDYDLSRAALSLPGTPGYQDISMLEEWPLRPTNDLFSLGVVMLQMLTGMPAIINERDRRQCLHAYLRNKGCFKTKGKLLEFVLKDVWPSSSGDEELTSSFAKLVDQCLQPFPEERISMDQLHESMKNLVNKSGCEMYNELKDEMLKDLCVACHVNEKVNDFPLLSKECSEMCNVMCVQCLIDSPNNELVCPRHGAAQPPIGHSESYAMFIGIINEDDNFSDDAKQMHKVFTDPKIGAIRKQNAILMTSCKSDPLNDRLIPTAENILHHLSCLQEKMEGKDEVSFLFYFSGHGSQKGSNVKCSEGQKLEASQLRSAIHDMNFTQLLIIMDCCYAAKVGPLSPPLLKSFTEGDDNNEVKNIVQESELEEMGIPNLLKAEITIDDKTLNQNESKKSPSRQSPNYSAVQWSASKCDQTSVGYQTGLSLFTSHIIAGLRASGDCQLRATKTHPQSTNQCDKCCSHKQKMQGQSYVTFNELSKYVFCHVRQQLQRHHEQVDQTPHTVAEENIRYNRKMAYCIS